MNNYPLKIVKGNYFAIAQPLEKITWENATKQVVDFVPQEGDKVRVWLVGSYKPYEMEQVTIENNVLRYEDNGSLGIGSYDIEIKVTTAERKRFRSYQKNKIKIVQSNEEAGIPDGDEFDVENYELDSAVLLLMQGPKGDKGNDGTVAFENLTPIQIEMLKGDRGDDGVGIAYIQQTKEGVGSDADNVMLFTMTGNPDNPVQFEFHVKNGGQGEQGVPGDTGVGIESVEQTLVSDEDGGTNEVTITLDDSQHTQMVVRIRNGSRGSQGPQGNTVVLGNEETYKLYGTPGSHDDGAMTQQAVSEMFETVGSSDVARMSDPE